MKYIIHLYIYYSHDFLIKSITNLKKIKNLWNALFWSLHDTYQLILSKESSLISSEFFLLMQIYFWVFKKPILKEKYEKYEKEWKYNELKKLFNVEYRIEKWIKWSDFQNMLSKIQEAPEYFKLQLMRKNITWAFPDVKIEKIYDKDWSEEKQREHINEINKEFGEEVIVEENE